MRKARSNWQDVVLVCRKCSKKLGGGFGAGGKKSLRKALRKELRLEKGRKARLGVVEVDCMKLCPKDVVTVFLGSEPGRMRAVAAGTPIAIVVANLGLSEPAPCGGIQTPDERAETSR
jgi:hypothetical protein